MWLNGAGGSKTARTGLDHCRAGGEFRNSASRLRTERAGRVGDGVGVQRVLLADDGNVVDRSWGRNFKKTGLRHPLVATQTHHNLESPERQIYRDGTLEEFLARPDFVKHTVESRRNDRDALQPERVSLRRLQMGHVDRSDHLHRLQRLPGGLQSRKQHPGRRQGPGRAAIARCFGFASTPITRGRSITRVQPHAGALHALRTRAVRTGLSGRGDGARSRRAESAGLQPLRRHAVLLEQLPLQSPPVQFPPVHRLSRRRASSRCTIRT